MKILAVSDWEVQELVDPAVRNRLDDVGLVLSCGDLPFDYLEQLTERLGVPLLYVLGNHDHGLYGQAGTFRRGPACGLDMDGRVEWVGGLLVAGLEGAMRYSSGGVHQYSEADMWAKALRLSPTLWANRLRHGRFLDILITHAPPYRIHDGPDLCHTGFKAFRWLMEVYRPRYLIHGHQHVYDPQGIRRTRYRQTEVINACGYQIIAWDETDRR